MKFKSTFLCFILIVNTLLYNCAFSQAINVRDSLVLVELYKATNGVTWVHHDNWLTGPVKSWHGIVTKNDRVSEIWLSFNNLTGAIPDFLDKLTALEFLSLSLNELTGSIPPTLGNLSKLESLYLDNNHLTGNIPPELFTHVNLKSLGLSNNQLTGAIPAEIGNLVNLKTLVLKGNQLSGNIPSEIGNLIKVGYVDMSFNQFSGSLPLNFSNLKNLGILYLNNNNLRGQITSAFSQLTNIHTLDLSHNHFNGNIAPEFTTFWIYPCNISYNEFTFDGMELLEQKFADPIYDNQARIHIHHLGNSLSVSAGGTLANNTYAWFKVGQRGYTEITGDSVFFPTESGSYRVRVINSIAKQLTLLSDTAIFVAPNPSNEIISWEQDHIETNLKTLVFTSPFCELSPTNNRNRYYYLLHCIPLNTYSLQ
ncbi:MAG TPA: hypothetical protein PLP23_21560 [Panacibacter sp.]|nr:hypothetical protein [Panacibacter sp.]